MSSHYRSVLALISDTKNKNGVNMKDDSSGKLTDTWTNKQTNK